MENNFNIGTFLKKHWYLPIIGGAFLVFWVALLSGTLVWYSNTPPLQVIDDMDNQHKVKAQAQSSFFADQRATREPVENTIPRVGRKYPYGMGDAAIAEQQLVNPLKETDFIRARGENRFRTFCSPCHGYDAKGNGLVVQRGFQNPPSLVRPEAVAYKDGRFFHVISAGQNIMSSYADKLSETDRWAIVIYIRSLQRTEGNAPAPTAATPAAGEPKASL